MSHEEPGPALAAADLDLRSDLSAIAEARRFTGQFLMGSHDDARYVAELLTSELVSNAVEHGSGHIRLSLDCVDGILRVRVRDASPHQPVLRRPTLGDERGRGLLLVERLALAWGVAPDLATGGKAVWFRLRTG